MLENNSQGEALHGIIIRSSIDRGRIESWDLPRWGKDFTPIFAADIAGENRIKVIESNIPLLTSREIAYRRQPIFAIFGPDIESNLILSQDIKISYNLDEPDSEDEKLFHSYSFGFGSIEEYENDPELVSVSDTYEFGEMKSMPVALTSVTACIQDEKLHINAPTQWPFLIKKAISDITAVPKNRIIVHREPFYAPYDEMLLNPVFLSAIAALGCMKSGHKVILQENTPSWKPRKTITRTTYLTKTGKPVAERIKAKIDMGAFPVGSEELAMQLYCGMMPQYRIDALRADFDIVTTSTFPANFFGTLGYSDGICTSEMHYTSIADRFGMSPVTFRQTYLQSYDEYQKMIYTLDSQEAVRLLERLDSSSTFMKKYFAYSMQKNMKARISTYTNYARGIGIAIGPGICGFSSSCQKVPKQKVQLTLDVGEKVICNTSFYNNGNSAKLWKSIIKKELEISSDDTITFTDDEEPMIDSGPSVLYSNNGNMSKQILKTCTKIKDQRFISGLPICEMADNFQTKKHNGTTPEFNSDSYAAVAVEVELDTITLTPLIRGIWVNILMSNVMDRKSLEYKIKHLIVMKLTENGAVIKNPNIQINIEIDTLRKDDIASVSSVIGGITAAAYTSALSQAAGSQISSWPIGSDTILNAIRKGGAI